MEHLGTSGKSLKIFAGALVALSFTLSACSIDLSLTEGASKAASALGWDQTALMNSGALQATWKTSSDIKVVQQELLYFKGASCNDPILPTLQLGASDTFNTATFTKVEGQQYTYKVYSMDATGKVVQSACSAPVTYQDTFSVSIIGSNKVSETNVAATSFTGRCVQGSTIDISTPTIPSVAGFNCASTGSWAQDFDLSGLPGVYSGDLVFSVTPSGGGAPKDYAVLISKDSVPPTIDIDTPVMISAANQTSYTLSGTCSEENVIVNLSIGSINTTATCTTGAFSRTLDLSSLTGNTISISATHKDAHDNTRSKFVITSRYVTVPTITSFTINSGDAATNSLTATLNMNVTDASDMYITNTVGCASGGSWETYSTSKTWTLPTANSTNTVYVKFRESHGNESACVSDSILHDNVAPTLAITSPTTGAYVNSLNVSSFDISGSCSENGRSITITGPNSFSATTACSGSLFSTSLNLGVIPQGSFQLSASQNDTAGNSSSANSPSYTKDTVAPTGSLVINSSDSTTTSLNTTLAITSADASEMYVTNTSGCSSGGSWETFATSKNWTLATALAINTVYSKFKDAAGNESSCVSDTIEHVLGPPEVSIASPASGAYINSGNQASFSISGGCSENGKSVVISVTGLSDESATCSSGAWTKSMDISSLADGSLSFTVNHSRSTGVDATPASRSFTKDTVAPTGTSITINSGDGFTSSLNSTLTLAATGATEMYITNTGFCLNGGTWETVATSKSWTLSTANSTNFVYFKTRDAAGNESSCISDSITHDNVIPTVAWTSPAQSSYINIANNANFALSGTCSEDGRTVSISITGQTPATSATCTSGAWDATINVSTLSDTAVTPYSFIATHARASGNSDTETRGFLKDVVAPGSAGLTGTLLANNAASNLNVTVGGTSVTHYKYFIAGPGDATACATMSAYTGSLIPIATKITDTLSVDGAYRLCVLGADIASNPSATAVSSSWNRDTVAPTVTSVTSTTANGTYGAGSVINVRVTFSEAVTVTGTPTIQLETGSTDRYATYTGGSGTANINFSYTVDSGESSSDLDYTATTALTGTLKDISGNSADLTLPAPGSATSLAGQKAIIINAPIPTAIISGYPTGTSSATNLNVTVSGTGVNYYKYAVISSGTCASAIYSSANFSSTPITEALSEVGNVTLCVIGSATSSGTYQATESATYASWIQDGMQPISVTSTLINRVDEGSGAQTITLSIPIARSYSFSVGYKVSGDATASNSNLTSGSVTFPAGTTSVNIPFSIAGNATADGEKLLNFNIESTTGATTYVGKNYQAQYYIADDEKNLTVTDLAVGRGHACAIMSDSSLRCWGHSLYGKLGTGLGAFKGNAVTINSGTAFKSVSLGADHSCAITTGNSLYCWGYNLYYQIGNNTNMSQLSPVLIGSGYKSISLGESHTCAITTSNKLRCWGRSDFGQVGHGLTTEQRVPLDIDAINDYIYVSAGSKSTCAITSAFKLRCWGLNTYYNLGDGTTTQRETPQDIDSSENYESVSVGSDHGCGVLTNGAVKCWGSNSFGQVGDSSLAIRPTPVLVDSSDTYQSVVTNDDTSSADSRGVSCAINDSNVLKCWGNNSVSMLGDGTLTNRRSPVVADPGTAYSIVKMSGSRACGVTTSGALKCWGVLDIDVLRNKQQYGAGYGTVLSSYGGFSEYFSGFSFTSISLTAIPSNNSALGCGISSGKLFCWGTQQVFGNGTIKASRYPAPILLDSATNYASLAGAHDEDMCAITTTGVLKCWGSALYGEFGTSSTAVYYVPTAVDAGKVYAQVSIAMNTTCGVTTAGELRCTGYNSSGGKVGNNSTADVTAFTTIDSGTTYKYVETGGSHTCGITTTGVLKCWGGNGLGQLGNGTTTDSRVPIIVDSGQAYKQISLSEYGTCGITTANTLKCWGGSTAGASSQLTPLLMDGGATYSDVSISRTNVCGILTAGAMRCWGDPNVTSAYPNPSEFGGYSPDYTPRTADSGTTYSKLTVSAGLVCGKTTAGPYRCFGRGAGKILGAVDAGGSAEPFTTTNSMSYAPVYLHKWLNY